MVAGLEGAGNGTNAHEIFPSHSIDDEAAGGYANCKPDCLNERNGHERGRQSGRHAESLSLIFAVSPNRGAESRSPGWMMEAGAFVKSAIRSG